MKKFLAIFTVVTMVLIGGLFTNQVSASAASVKTELTKSETSSSTKRITLKSGYKLQILSISYWYSKHTIKWTLFKNGKAHLSSIQSPNNIFSKTYTSKQLGPGQYSIRLYCGKNGGLKGCAGMAALNTKK
ncbi:hypothetical protein [Bacillus swezeyi]|uniref:hypothetical protein n=1 Tax=Bacillus swezeyi TaxID=1925020 RepID=UPI0027DBA269|nr:hypothetical protein [Bacillus swezeyi]